MRILFFTMLLLGSLSVFADVGEDRTSTHDGVMCQEEVGKTTTSSSDDSGAEGSEAVEG